MSLDFHTSNSWFDVNKHELPKFFAGDVFLDPEKSCRDSLFLQVYYLPEHTGTELCHCTTLNYNQVGT